MNLISRKHLASLGRLIFREASRVLSPKGIIPYFHRVREPEKPVFGPWSQCVTLREFNFLLDQFSREYCIVDVSELGASDTSQRSDRKTMVLTFDDGYSDFYSNVLPVLEERGLPATLFVTTSFLDDRKLPFEYVLYELIKDRGKINSTFDKYNYQYYLETTKECRKAFETMYATLKFQTSDYRTAFLREIFDYSFESDEVFDESMMLSSEELQELSNHDLVTLGLHGRNHVPVSCYEPGELKSELDTGIEEFERITGDRPKQYSYPYGVETFTARKVLKNLGIQWAFTTEERSFYGWDSYFPHQIPRMDASGKVENC